VWLVPALAVRLTAYVPIEWEEEMGAALMGELAPAELACADPERLRVVEALAQQLAQASPVAPYTIRVAIVDDSLVNAVAAPGGYIVVFRGMLEQAETPEEVAGVLAHEIQHVVLRHGTTAVLKELPLRLVTVAAGDAGGVLGAATTLGSLRYRRGDEEAADREGLRMLRAARISPEGMIQFFERLAAQGADAPAGLSYLSTHPRSAERIETLRQLVAADPFEHEPLLQGYDWSTVRAPCPTPTSVDSLAADSVTEP
jgi:predicted Zn-dependent protease